MNFLAPAGTPIDLADIWRSLHASAVGAGPALVGQMRNISGLPFAVPVSSARAGMTLVLRAMRAAARDVVRNEVIIPAYTCYSVPASIERAGLRPRLCDVDPSTLGIDPSVLARRDFSRVLAVVCANLYGLPDDLPAIEALCRAQGVYMLDDSAQALGARIGGRAAGSYGDAGVYSFDKGKIISTMQGGVIVAGPGTIQEEIARELDTITDASRRDALSNLIKLVVYSTCLRPEFYGLIRRLPFTGLGHTVYETRYPIGRLADFQIALAAILLTRLDTLNSGRRTQAARLTDALSDCPGLALIQTPVEALGAYSRFPFRVLDPGRRMRLIEGLNRAGIGATGSYPKALADVPEVMAVIPESDRHCPGARALAETIVTLPTHAYCPPDYAGRVLAVVSACSA